MENKLEIENTIKKLDEIVCVCDTETHQVIFVNELFKKEFNIDDSILDGKKTLKSLFGECRLCSQPKSEKNIEASSNTWECFKNPKSKKNYVARSKIIKWQGKSATLFVVFDAAEMAYITKTFNKELGLDVGGKQMLQYMGVFPGAFVQSSAKHPYKIYSANEEFFKVCGYTREQAALELEGNLFDCLSGEDASYVHDKIKKLDITTNPSIILSFRVLCRDKKTRWIKCGFSVAQSGDETILISISYDVTLEKNLERELLISDERLRIVLKQSKTSIWEYDINKRTLVQTQYSQESEQLVATSKNVPESLIENGVIHPESAEDIRELYARLSYGEKVVTADIKQKDAAGEYQWFKVTYTNIFDEKGKPVRAIGTLEYLINDSEIKERYRREMLYRDSINPELVASYRINFTRNWVESYKSEDDYEESPRNKMLTYEELLKSRVGLFSAPKERDEIYKKLNYHVLLENYKNGVNSVSVEYLRKISGGKVVWVMMTINLMKEPNSGDIIGFAYVRNIDERKKTELSLKERAERDDLTGLYSRRTVQLMINDSLNSNCEDHLSCALLMIDLDNFKAVNDTFGHLYGDRVLIDITKTISTFLGEQAISGRLGGDEFVMFIKNIPSKEWMRDKVEQLCHLLDKTYKQGEEKIRVTSSIGVVLALPKEFNYEKLLDRADLTMYDVKQKGKNDFNLIDTDPNK